MTPSRWLVPAFAGVVLYGLVELLNAAPPIANAGPDQLDVSMGTPVALDGTASSDPAGRPLTFAWKFVVRPAGSAATLVNPASATPSFTPDRNGRYEVRVTVKAGGEAATDTVVVITKNHPPTADAGPDTGAPIGRRVRLRGVGTDPDLDKLTFAWTLLSTPGSSRAAFGSPTKASTVLTLDRPGTYVAQLVVMDPFDASAIDTVEITHVNSAPIAAAGTDLDVPVGAVVTLDASASTDVDEDPLTYTWTLVKPKGSTASISDPDGLRPHLTVDVAGTYTATLVAHDGTVASRADAVAITTSPVNARPVANAGPDQRIAVGQTCHLDGSRSHDPNNQSLGYAWTLSKTPRDSVAALSSAAVRPTFVADVGGVYVAKLIVTDSAGRSSIADTIVLTTGNVAPIANAGDDRVAAVGASVQLRGSGSSDVDGNELAFGWALLHAPTGSAATLSDAQAVNPTFVPDVAGTYQFQLIVNDGVVSSVPDTVIVTTENVRPRAAAGPDQTVSVGSPVTLDGGASSDANGDPLVFSWTLAARPAGSAATLSDSSSPAPRFAADVAGDYVAQLRVSDGVVWSAHDAVVITTGNSVPVAEAGPDQIVAVGPVALDGDGSSDADNDALTYRWSFTARPEGSAAVLSGATLPAPAFTADVRGTYVAQLIVQDGIVNSAPDTVVIEVTEAPPPPLLPTVTVDATDAAAEETGPDPGTFTITRSGSLAAPLAVSFSIGGTASGADYTPALGGSVSIASGAASATITITPIDDAIAEPAESVNLTLTASSLYAIGTPGAATIIIADKSAGRPFRLFVSSSKILPEGQVGAAIVLKDPAGSSGLEATLRSSDDTVVSVPPTVTVPPGETYAWFKVTALSKLGSAIVSAEIVARGTATAPFTVSEESTGMLIERALAAGEISEEQAYIYRVFAAYGWPALPERFRGAERQKGPDPQSALLRDVRIRFGTLSRAAQEQLAPLLAPPIYVGSWGDPAVLAAAEAAGRGEAAATAADKRRLPAIQGEILCDIGSRPQRLKVWANYEEGPFRIWYLSDPLPYESFIGTPKQSQDLADVVRKEVEIVYSRLREVFVKPLLSDEKVGEGVCNGGDGLYDIYMYGLAGGLGKQFDYFDTLPSPSWIAMNAAADWEISKVGNKLILSTLAHEVMHAIDSLFAKTQGDATHWRVEALGQWAESFVYKDYNLEWDYADYFFSNRSVFNGALVSDVLLPLPTMTVAPGYMSKDEDEKDKSRNHSAYSKYVFFFYLEHRYKTSRGVPEILRHILEKEGVSAGALDISSMEAINEVLRPVGGFKAVWGDFVVTAWNDTKNGVKKEFSEWDPGLTHGMFEQFERGDPFHTDVFELKVPEKRVPLLGQITLTKPGGAYVPPAAAHWARAKFTDDSTSFVVLHPKRPRPDGETLIIQALFKANGKWTEPMNLSDHLFKVWCRDRPADKYPDHKLEEIVLIASNGRLPPASGTGADWNWFEDGPDGKNLIPHLVVSNAGCWQWTGRSSNTVEFAEPLSDVTQTNEATGITFELGDEFLASAARNGVAHLIQVGSTTGFGTATYQISGTTDDGCTFRGGPTPKALSADAPGALDIAFTKWLPDDATPAPEESRTVTGGGSEPEPPTMIVTCPGLDPIDFPMPWPHWMVLNSPPWQDRPAKLSEDGGRISGTFTVNLPSGETVRTTVNLSAVRK